MTKFLGKNKKVYIALHDAVGRNAYKVSKYWKLGPHLFTTGDGDVIIRLCYYRNSKRTYYSQISYQYREGWHNAGA